MKWQDKEIANLTDDELISANSKLIEMMSFYDSKTSDPRFLKRVGNNMPTVNPSFVALREEIAAELKKREIGHD